MERFSSEICRYLYNGTLVKQVMRNDDLSRDCKSQLNRLLRLILYVFET